MYIIVVIIAIAISGSNSFFLARRMVMSSLGPKRDPRANF
jgi:hypothetical protein